MIMITITMERIRLMAFVIVKTIIIIAKTTATTEIATITIITITVISR
jgi:hypothetical protein